MSTGLLRNMKVLSAECLHQDPPALTTAALSWEIRRADKAAKEGTAHPARALCQADPYAKAHRGKKYSLVS